MRWTKRCATSFRAREDAVIVATQAKYRLKAFLLRQGRRYPGRAGWTIPYRRWLAALSFSSAAQHIALQEYRDAIDETERRIERLTEQLRQLTPTWRWAPLVAALQALRSVSFITAIGVVTELGDLTRFGHPCELMAFLGLVPSEYSSGPSVRRGGITKAGNPHVRRLLAEAAWASQGIPRLGRQQLHRQDGLPPVVCDLAWKAQLRHRSASDVLDWADEPRREHTTQDGRLLVELDGPGWIIRNDFDRRLGCSPRDRVASSVGIWPPVHHR